jgi:beta-glucosidase
MTTNLEAMLQQLPSDFRWGAATAAYQVEGSADADGKGRSIWDDFSARPGATRHGDTGAIAADHYRRYESDADLMRDHDLDSYRFSIAWTRVQPEGRGPVNSAGLDHYERKIDALLARGIQPMATLFHWDLPSALEAEGGWYNRDTASRFADYSQVVLERLGDRVPHWITLNEPWTVVSQGYCRGLHAPGYSDYPTAGTAVHHMLLGHGLAVERFRELAPAGADIGITLIFSRVSPWSPSAADAAAAELMDAERNTVYLDPLFKGEYPAAVRNLFPTLFDDSVVRPGDLETISQPIDFVGTNYYLDQLARASAGVPVLGVEMLEPEGPQMVTNTAIRPEGLEWAIRRVTTEYTDLPQYITEVGVCLPDYVDPEGHVHDPGRIEYLRTCIEGIGSAVQAGSDVRGLYVWSLLDNLEWDQGYLPRFGLFYVDYRTQERIPKDSARWYSETIRAHQEGRPS